MARLRYVLVCVCALYALFSAASCRLVVVRRHSDDIDDHQMQQLPPWTDYLIKRANAVRLNTFLHAVFKSSVQSFVLYSLAISIGRTACIHGLLPAPLLLS